MLLESMKTEHSQPSSILIKKGSFPESDLVQWYFSNVFKYLPFLCILIKSTGSAMVPYLCPVFNTWFEYPELLLLSLIASICSSHLLVCPMCFMGSPNISFGASHFCFICLFVDIIYVLYCALCSECYFYLRVLESFCDFSFLYFPLYVEVVHFVFWHCGSASVF